MDIESSIARGQSPYQTPSIIARIDKYRKRGFEIDTRGFEFDRSLVLQYHVDKLCMSEIFQAV